MNDLHAVLRGHAQWALLRGDSLRQLPRMPAGVIDHVITDPPYSRDLYSRTRTNRGTGLPKSGTPYSRTEGAAHTSAIQLGNLRIGTVEDVLPHVAPEFMRFTKRWVIVFHDVECDHLWREQFGEAYVRTGVWVKTDPMPQVSGDRPGQGFEPCTIAHPGPGRMRWNGGGRAAVWRHGTAKGKSRPDHPCPKPLPLMLDLVRDFTNPGDLVIDPFAGSGTTGVACLELGRRFIGIERDPTYARAAVRRLRAASGRPNRSAA